MQNCADRSAGPRPRTGPAAARTRAEALRQRGSRARCRPARRLPRAARPQAVGLLKDAAAQDAAHRSAPLARPVGRAVESADAFRSLPIAAQRAVHELFTRSAGDVLDGWFEDPALKAALRLRCDRRQLLEPLHAGQRLRAAASRVRRSERQARRVGTRTRRHGRHHAGHGCGARPRSAATSSWVRRYDA